MTARLCRRFGEEPKAPHRNASKAAVGKASCECNDGFPTGGGAGRSLGKIVPKGDFSQRFACMCSSGLEALTFPFSTMFLRITDLRFTTSPAIATYTLLPAGLPSFVSLYAL